VYIAVSGRIAASLASDAGHLAKIERWKGFAFVGVTGVLLFFMSIWILTRYERVIAERACATRVLGEVQQKALAAEMAATVAHDFRNLLGVVQGSIELVNEASDPAFVCEISADILSASLRGKALADRLIATARGISRPTLLPRQVSNMVAESLRLVQHAQRIRSCEIVTRLDDTITAYLDEILVDQIVSNLVLNAGDATENRGKILVIVRDSDSNVVIEVHDNGPGLPPGVASDLFSPFRTSKPNGWGLGLVSVKLAAETHGGAMETIPSELGGAAFRIRLPKGIENRITAPSSVDVE
jgi:signal transduction histidine kinase